MDKYKILVVDDEEDICEILQYNLTQAGYTVDTAQSSEEALYKLKNQYNLLLLDIMMDGISGLKLAQLLRDEYNNDIPIIFISALDTETDVLNGFNKGGDDYIAKPFSIKEVVARVKAVLTRYNRIKEEEKAAEQAEREAKLNFKDSNEPFLKKFVFEDLVVDATDKRVYINNDEIILTKKENEILILLTQSVNKIFSRDEILKLVWKDESYVLERTVDVHIARLRKKLGKYGDMIINRSGYGYCFQN
ncbi:MAG: response regulator transcription factor [Bacteroidales bacterium]